MERIRLTRNSAHLKWIFTSTMTAFNEMMRKFRMETGGGPGHAKDVATWQDRPSMEIIDYNTKKISSLGSS